MIAPQQQKTDVSYMIRSYCAFNILHIIEKHSFYIIPISVSESNNYSEQKVCSRDVSAVVDSW